MNSTTVSGVSGAERSFAGPDPAHDGFFDAFLTLLSVRGDESLAVALAAQAHSARAGDDAGVVRALLAEGMARDALGHAERDTVLARALELAQRLGDPVLLLRATNVQVVVDIYRGRFADALTRGQAVLGLAHAMQRPDLLGRLLNNLANALVNIGEYVMSIALYKEWQQLLVGDSEETKLNRVRAANNEAVAWWRLARTYDQSGESHQVSEALERARQLAEHALLELMHGDHGIHRLNPLDTVVSVLLEMGQPARAMEWVQKVGQVSGELLVPDSLYWGMFAMALSRVELALPSDDLPAVLARLRAIEALPGPRFRGGEMQATLHACLADALERLGQHREALSYHRQWLRFEARSQSLWAREHAMAVHHTLDSLRGETEEFITHDLRNPLGAALVQMAEMATRPGLGAAGQQMLAAARLQVQQAVDAADFHLTIVRVRHLRRAGLQFIDLAELVDDVGERLAPPASAAMRLEREVEWGLEIRGDRISLLAALDCLLRIALDNALPGVGIGWRLVGAPGYALLVVVAPSVDWACKLATPRPAHGVRERSAPAAQDMAVTMLMRVAQLHDSQIEVLLPSPQHPHARIEWRFPLAGRSPD